MTTNLPKAGIEGRDGPQHAQAARLPDWPLVTRARVASAVLQQTALRPWSPTNLFVYSVHDAALYARASRYFRGELIDIGCGKKPYQVPLSSFVERHVGVDHSETLHGLEHTDLVGTAYAIPTADAAFDSALCSAVLEHLEEPEQALRECFRVLRPGGHAIYSVPFIWHLHEEPRDFFRYSAHGLRYLFEKVGFEVVDITPLSGFWGTFGQLLAYMVARKNVGRVARTHVLDLFELACQGAGVALEAIDPARDWPWMYMLVARRPPIEAPGK